MIQLWWPGCLRYNLNEFYVTWILLFYVKYVSGETYSKVWIHKHLPVTQHFLRKGDALLL